MKRRRLAIAALAALPGAALADYSLDCASADYAYAYCPADTRYGVELAERYSSADCTINESWGYDTGGVWVDEGCRARFTVFGDTRGAGPASDDAEGLIAPGVLGPLRDDDAEDGREPGHGRADAVVTCARYAAFNEAEHGASDVLVASVEQVVPRGRRSYDVKFTLSLVEASGAPRTPTGRCTVEDGEVTSYSRF